MLEYKKNIMSVQNFLESSDYGFDYYQFVLGDLRMAASDRCENIKNPFYGDKNPSFSIFFKDDMWRFHDHGDSTYSGNVFAFAAHEYGLDIKSEFWIVLQRMYEDLGITIPEVIQNFDESIHEIGYLLNGSIYSDYEGADLAYDYFKSFGITKKILREFRVRGIRSYYYVDKKGEIKEWNYRKSEIAIAYEDINHVKLYHPKNEQFKFQYRGCKPNDFVFGQTRIIRDMQRTGIWERDILIITAGEKDTMTLTSLGYDAICLNSETATSIPVQFEESIIDNYKGIIILYDLDYTGKDNAKKLQKKYGFKICLLPDELKKYGGKDVSDYVRLGLDIDLLKQAITDAYNKEVWIPKRTANGKIGFATLISGYINSKGEIINNDLIVSAVEEAVEPLINQTSVENDNINLPSLEAQVKVSEPLDIPSKDDNEPNFNPLENNEPDHFNAPFFPEDVFSSLPDPLKSICEKFDDKRERDIILFSSIAVLSTLFPSVKSINDGRIIGTNLNLFISAPAASGKGTANWAKKMGEGIQRHLREQFKSNLEEYSIAMEAFKKNKGKNPDLNLPERPKRKSLFIPANNSVSKVYEMVDANERFGIIFETEGDTLTGSLKTEWGNFSDVIRKCFHHETISLARRGDDELIEVENPHLSVLLTGTPEQINGLMQSVENGFFSRFAFYDFQSEVGWKSQFKKKDTSLHYYFQSISEHFYRVWLRQENVENTFIYIPENLIVEVDSYFAKQQLLLSKLYGKEIIASVNRTCLIWQRIAMILTALRHLEVNKTLPSELHINPSDGRTALKIVDVMLCHLKAVFARMKSSTVSGKLNNQQNKAWESLSKEFERKDYDAQVKMLEIEYKTGEKYLQDFIKKGLLERVKHGVYRKIE